MRYLKIFLIISFIINFALADKLSKPFVQMGHRIDVKTVAFSPNSKLLVSGSLDNTMKIWDIKSGKLLKTIKENAFFSIAFSSDSKLFYCNLLKQKKLFV